MSAPEVSISASRLACASKWSSGAAIGQPRAVGEQRAHALGELGVRVEAGAGGRAAERDLPEPRQRVLDARAAELDLRRVAAELLAERDGHRVHEVRAPGLDDLGERRRLGRERRLELAERRQQVVGRRVERREVHGRGEDVVRRLAEVDVVVRVHALAGERGHDLVRVHVRRGARAGLEDVDRELVVVLAGRDRVTRGGDARGELAVEQAEIGVHARSGGLDAPEPVHHAERDRPARDREVVDGLACLGAPQLTHAPIVEAGGAGGAARFRGRGRGGSAVSGDGGGRARRGAPRRRLGGAAHRRRGGRRADRRRRAASRSRRS